MDYSSLGTVTGACHAPVAGRQGNAEDWEVNGDALLENPDCHVEDDVLRSILTENMLDAMCHLSEIEQKVITHLYLSDDPMTNTSLKRLSVSRGVRSTITK